MALCPACDEKQEAEIALPDKFPVTRLCNCDVYTRWICYPCKVKERNFTNKYYEKCTLFDPWFDSDNEEEDGKIHTLGRDFEGRTKVMGDHQHTRAVCAMSFSFSLHPSLLGELTLITLLLSESSTAHVAPASQTTCWCAARGASAAISRRMSGTRRWTRSAQRCHGLTMCAALPLEFHPFIPRRHSSELLGPSRQQDPCYPPFIGNIYNDSCDAPYPKLKYNGPIYGQ